MPTEFPEDARSVQALRDGLHAQPVPAVSPDFDARVLAALRQPAPWHQCLWQSARPVFVSAAGSLGVTLIVLHWALSGPVSAPAPPPLTAIVAPERMPPLDALLNRPDLCEATLEQVWNAPPPPAPPPPADRRPEPRRHASLLPTPPTIA